MAMELKEFTAALAEKITSKEQFDELLLSGAGGNKAAIGSPQVKTSGGVVTKEAMSYLPTWSGWRPAALPVAESFNPCFGTEAFGFSNGYLHHTRWWLAREWLRVRYGIYQMSAPLWKIASHGYADWAAHVAVGSEDTTLIAYTPDPAAGEADRQIRTTLSKFMRKTNLALPDDTLRDLEAAHRAELSNELELLTDPTDIVAAYTNSHLSSCMSYPASYFAAHLLGRHPVEAYSAPGIALAVLRAGDGKVNARAITFVNPDDPTDKRYVRLYGDVALRRKLERKGYRMAGLAGARIKRVHITGHENYREESNQICASPYLDPPGGGGSGCYDMIANTGIIDGDYFLLVGKEQQDKLNKQLHPRKVVGLSTSSGVVTYDPRLVINSTMLRGTCPLSGEEYDTLTAKLAQLYRADGTTITVLAKSLSGRSDLKLLRRFDNDDCRMVVVYAERDTPSFFDAKVEMEYLDNEETRYECGYVLLTERFYTSKQWVQGDKALNIPLDPDNVEYGYLLRLDAVQVIDAAAAARGRARWTHVRYISSELHRPVHRIDSDYRCYADRSSVATVTTVSGRVVVPNVHDVSQLWDGRWDFNRNVDTFTHCGMRIKYRAKEGRPQYEQYKHLLPAHLREWMLSLSTDPNFDTLASWMQQNLRYFVYSRDRDEGRDTPYVWRAIRAASFSRLNARQDAQAAVETARLVMRGMVTLEMVGEAYLQEAQLRMYAEVLLMAEAAMLGRDGIDLGTPPPVTEEAAAPAVPTTAATDARFVLAA